MKVPLSWLKEYVNFEADAAQVAERLTSAGIEVTALTTVSYDLPGVVVSEILSAEPYPREPNLFVCRVSTGRSTVTVVCGARNFKVGDKVPLATPGTVLPSGRQIQQMEIQGIPSEGMLCAEDELGLSDDHSGLLLLPEQSVVGSPLSTVLGHSETVFDLEVTWNRPDCLSILGIAREVSAIFRRPLRLPPITYPESGPPIQIRARVTIEDPEGCPRYVARLLENVKYGPSPLWMRRRLTLCGIRPLSNVVDVTNYVMLECGQPLHAFDFDRVAGQHIVVRRAKDGERMRTLDNVERCLSQQVLVIADADTAIAIAGVMGGAESAIALSTSRVLLESANFDPRSIRQTSSLLDLSTEASHRFERGVDILGADWASRRAAQLILATAGGEAARGSLDAFLRPPTPREITYRFRRGNELLGIRIAPRTVTEIFKRLGFQVVARNSRSCTVRIPSFRGDLELEADLVEEVARIHGLDKIPAGMPLAAAAGNIQSGRTRALLECRRNLAGLGLSEILNYSFVAQQLLDLFQINDPATCVVLPNPVSAEHAVLRNYMAPQMVETLRRNLSHQILKAAFFEIGKVFKRQGSSFQEEDRVCIGLMGPAGRFALEGKRSVDMSESFLWLKGIIEALFTAQHAGEMRLSPTELPFLQDGWTVSVRLSDENVGYAGLLEESLRRKWRFPTPVAIAELRLDPLLQNCFRIPEIKPISPFPAITRDLAIIVSESIRNEDVVRAIRACAPPELTEIELFDIFRGGGIRAGRRSLAYSLTYRALDRTLTDEEANRYHERIMSVLRESLRAEIRDGKPH